MIAAGASSASAAIALVAAPFAVLLIVTFGSIRIIRRHERDLWVPYGPAISLAGIWIVASGQLLAQAGPVAGGGEPVLNQFARKARNHTCPHL
jgi:prepilin peptidase CpaA